MNEGERAGTRRRRMAVGVAITVVVAVAVLTVVVARGFARSSPTAPGAVAADAAASTVPPSSAPTSSTTTAPPGLPSARPPAAVGRTELTVTDDSRSTGARGDRPAHAGRTLEVTVLYPVAGPPGPGETADAPPTGRSPLVVFAHGFDTAPDTYAALLHDLAAAGFVVAAPEFPLSTSNAPGEPVEGDEEEQARDLGTVIDRLTDWVTAPALAESIRPGPVGLVGHSDGAVTALLAGYAPELADARVGAVVDVSGADVGLGGPWFSVTDPPLLSLHGSEDEIDPVSNDATVVDEDPGPAALVVVRGASHLGAVTGPSEPAVARLIGDDLAWRLEDAPGGAEAVALEASTPPLRVEAGGFD